MGLLLADRAQQVRELVSQYTLRQQGTSLDTVLQTALGTVQRSEHELTEAARLLVALQNDARPDLARGKDALQRLATVQDSVAADPIAHVESEDGQELIRFLTDATRELEDEVNRRWALLRAEFEGEYPEEFVNSMARVQAFSGEAHAVTEAREKIERALELRRPDPSVIERARLAKKEVEERLQRLNELVPSGEVRTQFAQAVNGTLLLTEVRPAFLKWVKDEGLEQSFRVTVR
jgi:hypothetical protein